MKQKFLVIKNAGVAHEYRHVDGDMLWCGLGEWLQVNKFDSKNQEWIDNYKRTRFTVINYKPNMPICANCLRVKQQVVRERG